jgi:hypothetical protein
MPILGLGKQVDDDDELFKEDIDGTDDAEDEEEAATDDSTESDEAPDGDEGGETPRLRALMSLWQKEQAKANRLEKEVERLSAGGTPTTTTTEDGTPPAGNNGETSEHLAFMRSMTRDTLFASDPRLATYGFSPDAIEGNSPTQMRTSLKNLQTMIDRIEGVSTSKTLKKHGMVPSITEGGGPADRKRTKSVENMTDEEFNKLTERVKGTL